MHVLLVHGLGRTPLSMKRLGRALRRSGAEVSYFGYLAAAESVESIVGRLQQRLTEIAARSEYSAVGHSLGGLLLRTAVAGMPASVRRPRHIVMLGTPHTAPRLARRFQSALWYRFLNGDAGRMLASSERMAAVPLPTVPYTVVAGTQGPRGFVWRAFDGEPHDGIVALSEARIAGGEEPIVFPVSHPWIMNDARVRQIVRERCLTRGS